MEGMIFNNTYNVTKEEQLQNYFGSFDSDKVDALVDKVEGRKQKSIARELLQEVPNLLNTDIYSLKISFFSLFFLRKISALASI